MEIEIHFDYHDLIDDKKPKQVDPNIKGYITKEEYASALSDHIKRTFWKDWFDEAIFRYESNFFVKCSISTDEFEAQLPPKAPLDGQRDIFGGVHEW